MVPRIQRPASRIPRMRRAFSQSSPDLLAGLQRETSVHGFESGLDAMIEDSSEYSENSEDSDDSDDEHLDIGEVVQLSYQEFKEAELRRTDIIERAAIAPSLETIPEDSEVAFESERDEDIIEQAQDDLADQSVEQEQGDQNTGTVEENRDITNDLAVKQTQDGQDDHSDQDQNCLRISQLGDYAQHNQTDDTIKTVEGEQNGQNGQNDQTVGQPEDNQEDQLGQNGQIEQDIETVEQNRNEQDQNGQIDKLKSTDSKDQNKKAHQRISSGTHATSGQSGGETTFQISNEQQNQDTNVQAVDSELQTLVTDQKNKKWKKRISHISQKARNALRSKHAQSPKSDSSSSFESIPSPTSNCDPDRQYISLFHTETPQNGDEKPHKTSSTKKLATKAKRVLSKSSTEKDTVTPKKQRRISFSDLFYEGIRAFESYSVMA